MQSVPAVLSFTVPSSANSTSPKSILIVFIACSEVELPCTAFFRLSSPYKALSLLITTTVITSTGWLQ